MRPISGTIFDIQRFSVHDGPGARSTVFFKGCPLSCRWCSNPESQGGRPELMFFGHLCSGCGACIAACPHEVVELREGRSAMLEGKCRSCGLCVKACPRHARSLSGRIMSVDEVCAFVREDWRMYMQSGGGVTCGGGEAMAQPVFLRALLTALHDDLGFHTCLDTSGFSPWDTLESLLPVLDLVLLDIKHMDSTAHRQSTGVDNAAILKNAAELGRRNFPVIVRLPLIPGFNDDALNIGRMGNFLRNVGLNKVEIMPYHNFGMAKYQALGREYPGPSGKIVDAGASAELLRNFGLEVDIHEH